MKIRTRDLGTEVLNVAYRIYKFAAIHPKSQGQIIATYPVLTPKGRLDNVWFWQRPSDKPPDGAGGTVCASLAKCGNANPESLHGIPATGRVEAPTKQYATCW